MEALLVLTKGDLASADALRATYEPLGVTVLTTSIAPSGEAHESTGVEALRAELADQLTVLVGYSGVGTSTPVNALVLIAQPAVGVVNDTTGRGRHTSTSAVALELPGGGRIIDTPGIRSFGLAHVNVDNFIAAFPDVAEAALEHCPRGCTHESPEAGCAL